MFTCHRLSSSVASAPGLLRSRAFPYHRQAPALSIPLSQDVLPLPPPEASPKKLSPRVFDSKSSMELLRGYLVFKACENRSIVKASPLLLKTSYRVLGKTLTNTALRHSFFGHFCAGENAEELKPVVKKLASDGIGAILDYAAEADVATPRDLNGVSQTNVSARTYDYEGEGQCDLNAEIALRSIEDASNSVNGFSAIKCTALGKPELLMRMSDVLMETRRLFRSIEPPNLNPNKDGCAFHHSFDYATLEAGFRNAGIAIQDEELRWLFNKMDRGADGVVDYVEWLSFMNPVDLTMGPFTQFLQIEPLSEDEKQQLLNMVKRLEMLASSAAEKGVRLMVDAEQTYMQPAIDHLVLNLQRQYNQGQSVIFNTFQCYLKDSHKRMELDLRRAKEENFYFACKLVRGAYMVQERKRAQDLQYADPIHASLQDTHDNYDSMVEMLLRNNDSASFMIASHNVNSIEKTVKRMETLGIPKKDGGVFFGQLLGMCDHVSYPLGHEGYQVYKYVPYGPIEEVVPYLVRRAEENCEILVSSIECDLRFRELQRRLLFTK